MSPFASIHASHHLNAGVDVDRDKHVQEEHHDLSLPKNSGTGLRSPPLDGRSHEHHHAVADQREEDREPQEHQQERDCVRHNHEEQWCQLRQAQQHKLWLHGGNLVLVSPHLGSRASGPPGRVGLQLRQLADGLVRVLRRLELVHGQRSDALEEEPVRHEGQGQAPRRQHAGVGHCVGKEAVVRPHSAAGYPDHGDPYAAHHHARQNRLQRPVKDHDGCRDVELVHLVGAVEQKRWRLLRWLALPLGLDGSDLALELLPQPLDVLGALQLRPQRAALRGRR
mmetsp:Transcript_105887/g.330171  ORF Transcript_105887/g.330171 Transcript_105887/m.330171 type:complete len:281 (+) Transcript_105887:341-1183(+)